MFTRRSILYIMGIAAVFTVFYVAHRAYLRHVEVKDFIKKTETFSNSVGKGYAHPHTEHPHQGEKVLERDNTENGHHERAPSGEYVYNKDGIPIYSDTPMSDEESGAFAWVSTGQMNPDAQQYLNNLPKHTYDVVQRVVTPDGNLRHVVVPKFRMYEEGDALLESELDYARDLLEKPIPLKLASFRVDGVKYSMPDEYYAIEDIYESEMYLHKYRLSKTKNISMAEVDKQIAAGEISLDKLSQVVNESIKRHTQRMEREKMLLPPAPALSAAPPVKVSFLPDEGEGALPGWMRKRGNNRSVASAVDGAEYSATDFVSGQDNLLDKNTMSLPTDSPRSPSDLSDMVESTPSPPSVERLEKQLTPEGIEAELTEGLSTDPADKAQQLIVQYGTEEGLRRLREMDPDAARQFEIDRESPSSDGYSDDPPPDDSR